MNPDTENPSQPPPYEAGLTGQATETPPGNTDEAQDLNSPPVASTKKKTPDLERSRLERSRLEHYHRLQEEQKYCYYRVYAPDGAIPSKDPVDPQNPYLARILKTSLPFEEHNATVTSLKLFLLKEQTHLRGREGADLFLTPQAYAGLAEKEPPHWRAQYKTVAPILTGFNLMNNGTAEAPFALVLREDMTADENATIEKMLEDTSNKNPSYRAFLHSLFCSKGASFMGRPPTVYYQLRTRNGEGISKTGNFLGNYPNLGRIDRALVSPPHGSATLLRYIAKVEGKPIYTYSELLCGEEGIWAKQAIEGPFALMKKSSPLGWTEDKPMILVEPERRRELFNRPFKVLSGHRAAGWPHGLDPTGLCADKWKRGDLGFTDGFITQMYPFIARDMVHCNIHGMWGYLPKDDIKLLDE
ncbi:hypothetical protein DFH08DRAFT_1089573 [Mycena albidolilacea]|uniref:Uncharacterized protein n=1 Tax=Mycena albidolilacea TaxID=1033008 RepID=A0AAD6Z0V0_9AGAR|nr:hypothetical protein DFH08DRAFT_1089573 [Mycena albidolilacea]